MNPVAPVSAMSGPPEDTAALLERIDCYPSLRLFIAVSFSDRHGSPPAQDARIMVALCKAEEIAIASIAARREQERRH